MIYFDNAATTKTESSTNKCINYILENKWGNPSSLYSIGREAKDILEDSRKDVAKFINANHPNEIIFTSGACESNSLALSGFLKANSNYELVTSKIEHKSIIDLGNDYNAKFCDVDSFGNLNIDMLINICEDIKKRNKFPLVSIQYANNEIGTIQKIKDISDIVHKKNGVFHTDATQAIADRPIDVIYDNVDMMSFSGQKIKAPKGIGVLYKKNSIKIKPIIYGSQEFGLRGGTENIPYIYALSNAIKNIKYIDSDICNYFLYKIKNSIKDCKIIGNENGNRLKNNISLFIKDINAESILYYLDCFDIYISTGSACNSNSKYSYVLKSIGINEEEIHNIIRISINENTRKEEIDFFIDKLIMAIKKINNYNFY